MPALCSCGGCCGRYMNNGYYGTQAAVASASTGASGAGGYVAPAAASSAGMESGARLLSPLNILAGPAVSARDAVREPHLFYFHVHAPPFSFPRDMTPMAFSFPQLARLSLPRVTCDLREPILSLTSHRWSQYWVRRVRRRFGRPVPTAIESAEAFSRILSMTNIHAYIPSSNLL